MPSQFVKGFTFSITDGCVREVEYDANNGWGVKDGKSSWTYGNWTPGKDVFHTVEAAIAAGEIARDKRLAGLRKQVEKLEAMQFKLI